MVPPINPDKTKSLSVFSPARRIINPAVIEKRNAAPRVYPVALLRDFNFFRLKNHHPQIIPSIGKITQEIPNVFLMKKSAIKTPTIPMGFSVGKLGGIPLTSSLGLNPIKLAKTSREMIMIKIPIISNLRSFILTYFLESENI